MIEFIQSETKKIMYKCCERYAAKMHTAIDKVQLVLGLDEDGENTYLMCVDYAPKENFDIMQVLGVRIDFLGYSKMAPPFIMKSLIRFSQAHDIELGKVEVMCVPTKNERGKDDILLFLYNGSVYVETITFADLFREEDFEIPQA